MTDLICPECQSTNPVSESLCDQCGCPLDGVLTPGGNSPAEEQTCHQCGAGVARDANFCDGCGGDLTGSEDKAGPDADTDQGTAEPVATAGRPAAVDAAPEETAAVETAATNATEPEPLPLTDEPGTDQPLWKLTAVEGLRVGKEYVLYREEMLLGRMDPDDDIFPDLDMEDQDDGYVSRRHAKILVAPDEVLVVDLGGENGTLIDSRPIPPNKPMPVRRGQVIKVGKVGLMLQYHRGQTR